MKHGDDCATVSPAAVAPASPRIAAAPANAWADTADRVVARQHPDNGGGWAGAAEASAEARTAHSGGAGAGCGVEWRSADAARRAWQADGDAPSSTRMQAPGAEQAVGGPAAEAAPDGGAQTVFVRPGDTTWGYWKSHGQGQGWSEFRRDFDRDNAAILKDGWLHPGEVARLPGGSASHANHAGSGEGAAADVRHGPPGYVDARSGVARNGRPGYVDDRSGGRERVAPGHEGPGLSPRGPDSDPRLGQEPDFVDGGFRSGSAAGAGDNDGAAVNVGDTGSAPGAPKTHQPAPAEPAAPGEASLDASVGGRSNVAEPPSGSDAGPGAGPEPPASPADPPQHGAGNPQPPLAPEPPAGQDGAAPHPGPPRGPAAKPDEPASADPGHAPGSGAPVPPVGQPPAVPPPSHGPGGQGAGTAGSGGGATPPYSRADDAFVDWADWGKQISFANRAVPRIWLDSRVAANPNDLNLKGWNNASKVFGLGVFSIFQTASKTKSAIGYYGDGDPWRGTAEVSDLVNGLRIGFNGFKPLMELSPKVVNAPWFQTVAKYAGGDNGAIFKTGQANKVLGLSYGNAFGVGANVLAGGLRGVAIYNDYQEAMAKATTPLDRDRATHGLWQGEIGNALDTANDAAPFVIDGGVSWSTWLVGKVADHAAANMLEGSGYKPLSFGNDHARNLMGLASGIGLAPSVPWKDPASARSADERLVISTSNSVHKAAGIGAGVTDIAVTATEGVAVGYLTGGNPTAIYGAWNVDHAIRQGVNIWTDHFWQRPAEREAAVAAAGLDPRLDTRAVEYGQEDFLHRLWAGATLDFTAAFKTGKDIAGGASASDKRWLELDTMYSSPAISNATSGRGDPNGWFSPNMVWQAAKLSNPALMSIDQAPQQAGIVAGWVAGGGIPRTYDKVKDAIDDGYSKFTNTVSSVKNDVVNRAGEAGAAVGDAAWQVKTTVTATLDQAWTATAYAAGSAKDTVTDWGAAAKKKADQLIDSVAFWR